MKNAKNDKTIFMRERLRVEKRLRFARLIVALCLTAVEGVCLTDEAYSQTSNVQSYSSSYTNSFLGGQAQGSLGSPVIRSNGSYVGQAGSVSGSSYSSSRGRNLGSNRLVSAAPTTIPKSTSSFTSTSRATSTPSSTAVPALIPKSTSNSASTSRTTIPALVPASVPSPTTVPTPVSDFASVPSPEVPSQGTVGDESDASARPSILNTVVPTNEAQFATQRLQEAVATLQETPTNLETLETAMQIALEQSRTQRALALKKGAARSTTEAARSLANPKITNATAYVGLAERPTIETSVGLPAEIGAVIPGLSQLTANSILSDKEFATTSTAVTIPIYLGGRVTALTRVAEATTAAIEAGEDVGEQTVKSQTSEAYFLVLRTRKLHEVAVEGVQTTQAHLDDAQRMLNVGLVTRNVVLAAQVANAEAKQLELRVANAQNLAEAAYNRILWRPLDSKVEIADVGLDAPLGELETLTEQAVRTRAELRVLQNESRAMQEQEKVARADVLPQVAVVGAYTYLENQALKENSNGVAAVGMVWTPFDGGTSRARRDAARQNAMAIARTREEAESGVRLQVRQAWLEEQEARERVEVARVAVEQAEENLRVVTRGFQEGLVNHTEALDASTMRTTAKSNFANAQYDAILATQRLRRAVGIL